MNRKVFVSFSILVVTSCLISGSVSRASKFNRVVDVGQQAPVWKNLVGIDDKKHSLTDFRDAKAVVIVFSCNHCPVAQAYEERLKAFVKDYKEKGVALLAINVNNIPSDRLDKMKQRAEKREFNFPYLYDPSQKTARAYGATCTPHAFLLDKDRKIAYMGKIDDNMNLNKVTELYLRDAVDAVLAGDAPEVTETRQIGCGILYDSKP